MGHQDAPSDCSTPLSSLQVVEEAVTTEGSSDVAVVVMIVGAEVGGAGVEVGVRWTDEVEVV